MCRVHRKERLGGIRLWGTLNTITMNLGFIKCIEKRNHNISNRERDDQENCTNLLGTKSFLFSPFSLGNGDGSDSIAYQRPQEMNS